jgi:prepilin-type N-terminal cleavage/methylation domain-containing protein
MVIKNKFFKRWIQNTGFTLIELLVVIAILGVLAGSILVAINPIEQLARSRDAARKSTISQLGNAVQAYYTSQGSFPTEGNSWMTTGSGSGGTSGLVAAGELKSAPSAVTPPCGNTALAENGYCYDDNGTDAVIYALGESISEKTRASCAAGYVLWIVWSSAEGKTGAVCKANASTYPQPGETGLK